MKKILGFLVGLVLLGLASLASAFSIYEMSADELDYHSPRLVRIDNTFGESVSVFCYRGELPGACYVSSVDAEILRGAAIIVSYPPTHSPPPRYYPPPVTYYPPIYSPPSVYYPPRVYIPAPIYVPPRHYHRSERLYAPPVIVIPVPPRHDARRHHTPQHDWRRGERHHDHRR